MAKSISKSTRNNAFAPARTIPSGTPSQTPRAEAAEEAREAAQQPVGGRRPAPGSGTHSDADVPPLRR